MTKGVKLLIIFILISVGLVFYLVASFKRVTVSRVSNEVNQKILTVKTQKVDPKKLEAGYKIQVKAIVDDYEQLVAAEKNIDTSAVKMEKIFKLKGRATDLSVPEQYRDLHLDLVLAFAKLESSLSDDGEADELGMDFITQTKEKYEWLN